MRIFRDVDTNETVIVDPKGRELRFSESIEQVADGKTDFEAKQAKAVLRNDGNGPVALTAESDSLTAPEAPTFANGDTFSVGGTTFTFKDTPTLSTHVQVGADAGESCDNAAEAVNSVSTTVRAVSDGESLITFYSVLRGAAATGIILLSASAGTTGETVAGTDGSSVTINGNTYNFASPVLESSDVLGSSADASGNALAAAIEATDDELEAEYVDADNTLYITVKAPGAAGNSISATASSDPDSHYTVTSNFVGGADFKRVDDQPGVSGSDQFQGYEIGRFERKWYISSVTPCNLSATTTQTDIQMPNNAEGKYDILAAVFIPVEPFTTGEGEVTAATFSGSLGGARSESISAPTASTHKVRPVNGTNGELAFLPNERVDLVFDAQPTGGSFILAVLVEQLESPYIQSTA